MHVTYYQVNYWQFFILDLSRPTLRELCEKVTPNFAAHWRRIGISLDIHHGELEIIESDCFRDCRECCDRMLAKWLDVDVNASWEKLRNAITSAMYGRPNDFHIYARTSM